LSRFRKPSLSGRMKKTLLAGLDWSLARVRWTRDKRILKRFSSCTLRAWLPRNGRVFSAAGGCIISRDAVSDVDARRGKDIVSVKRRKNEELISDWYKHRFFVPVCSYAHRGHDVLLSNHVVRLLSVLCTTAIARFRVRFRHLFSLKLISVAPQMVNNRTMYVRAHNRVRCTTGAVTRQWFDSFFFEYLKF
jgi:hypothetical protein